MHDTITLAILCSHPPKYGMTICLYVFSSQHHWDVEILDGSVLLRTSVFESSVQPSMARRQGEGGAVSHMVKKRCHGGG